MGMVRRSQVDEGYEKVDKKENKRHYLKMPEVYNQETRSQSDKEDTKEEEVKKPQVHLKTSLVSKFDNFTL